MTGFQKWAIKAGISYAVGAFFAVKVVKSLKTLNEACECEDFFDDDFLTDDDGLDELNSQVDSDPA